ncbi:hypothetical protein GCM10027049_16220 [Mucilaginibacter puniceus]
MEQTVKTNVTKVATKWALISAITGIIITYAFEFLNVDQNSSAKYLAYIPFIAFLILAQKEFRDELGGYITFGEAYSTGFRYALFTGLITALFTYVYLKWLSPEMMDKVVEAARTSLEEKDTPSDQAEKALEMTKQWGPLFGAFGVAIGYAIFGAIVSLVGAAILKKVRSPYDIANEAVDPSDPTV